MTTPAPLPYQSPDIKPRVPARAWIFLLIAWAFFFAPLLLQLGPGPDENVRHAQDILRHLGLYTRPSILRVIIFIPFLFQSLIIVSTALVARRSVKQSQAKFARFVRIAASGVILLGTIPLFALAYVLFSIIR